MNFLSPWFLVGVAAVAGPVIFHLIRRTTRERTLFSTLMFLQPTLPRMTRRSRLEDLLLLCLRAAALALLALGFARPFFKQAPAAEPVRSASGRIALLIDTSASMRREGLFAKAIAAALDEVRGAGPGDQVAVFAFGRQVRPVVSFSEWMSTPAGDRVGLVTARLKELQPGWESTGLGDAVIRGVEAILDTDSKTEFDHRHVVLISDLQEGGHPEALQHFDWPRGFQLLLRPVRASSAGNAAVQIVNDGTEADPAAAAAGARVRVINTADARSERFTVGWSAPEGAGTVGMPLEAYVPPGQSRILTLPFPTNVPVTRALLGGDPEAFDNAAYVVPPRSEKLNVHYLGSESATNVQEPLFFFRRALPQNAARTVEIVVQDSRQAWDPAVASRAPLFVVGDVPSEEQTRGLRTELDSGKTVLVLARRTPMGAVLGALVGKPAIAMEDVVPAQFSLLAEIDFRHPWFVPFADPRFGDFTPIHVWRHQRLDAAALPGARVVVRFDNGDPAILEVPMGRGRLLVMTFGWQPVESQLALSTKFVPLMVSLIELAGGRVRAGTPLRVGDPVKLPREWVESGAPTGVRRPDGIETNLPAGAVDFAATDQPGIYDFSHRGESWRVAVNLDPGESRTLPLAGDDFERLGIRVREGAAESTPKTAADEKPPEVELESRQKLWRWFLMGTLAVLVAETMVGGWLARRSAS